jgi:translation initiation factor 1
MARPPRDPPAPAPFHTPFAGLSGRLGLPTPSAPPEPAAAPPPPEPKAGPARAVVRLERKGRGGKTVTVVEKLGLRPRELDAWLADLKRALGCGGVLEDGALVLQGDLRDRVARRLEERGVRQVVLG